MKLTEKELEAAKRASKRLWCQDSTDGKHTLCRMVMDGSRLVWRCRCGFELRPKKIAP